MKKKFNKCNIYILIWVIQLCHTALNLYGDTVSIMVLMGLFAWSLYYFHIAITRYKLSPFLKIWSVLFIIFSIYGIIRMVVPSALDYSVLGRFEVSSRQFLIEHWTSMLPVFPFFVFSKTGLLNYNSITRWAVIFVGVAILQYYYGISLVISRLGDFAEGSSFVNNQGYFIAMVMPLMFFLRKKPIIQYVGCAILMVFVLLAVKRGAILVGAFCLLMQVFYSTIKSKVFKKPIAILAILVFFIFGYYYVLDLLSNNDLFAFRMEQTLEGDESGRQLIYSRLFKFFSDSDNPFTWLFGMGADGTILVIQQQAHNDWLELLIDMGISGFVVYLVFWLRAFSERRRFMDKDIKYLYSMVIIMLFLRTFFSMSINDIHLSINIILGYCLANINNEIEQIKNHVKA